MKRLDVGFILGRRQQFKAILVFCLMPLCGTGSARITEIYNNTILENSAVLTFLSSASGGELHVVNLSNDTEEEARLRVQVQTDPELSSSAVSHMLADELLNPIHVMLMPSAPRSRSIDRHFYRERWKAAGSIRLYGDQGEIVLGGTETGLGILPPVGSVSAAYNGASREYSFRWHEKSDYDEVYVRRFGKQRGGPATKFRGINDGIPFYTTSKRECDEFPRRPYYVVAFQNGMPTNASYIMVDQHEQLDSFFGPFTNNITTNWTGWSLEPAGVTFDERPFSDDWLAPPLDSGRANVRRSAQLVLSDRTGGQGGLYRSFIAQTPGKIYRPSIRYRVMEEAADFAGEWSFDIMVGAISMDRSYELDEATRVRDADAWSELASSASHVRTWRADHSAGDAGAWVVSETGSGGSSVPQKDIKLDEERPAIFICVRLTGLKPNGIAMDSVRLQDVTESGVH
ncbi:MAG: hypothetical protein KF886_03755 [Candidatus Hydrogenedentes bacterium]|nr:hypothetical protein [Candidatus Hydrogenedentota bacterium]